MKPVCALYSFPLFILPQPPSSPPSLVSPCCPCMISHICSAFPILTWSDIKSQFSSTLRLTDEILGRKFLFTMSGKYHPTSTLSSPLVPLTLALVTVVTGRAATDRQIAGDVFKPQQTDSYGYCDSMVAARGLGDRSKIPFWGIDWCSRAPGSPVMFWVKGAA